MLEMLEFESLKGKTFAYIKSAFANLHFLSNCATVRFTLNLSSNMERCLPPETEEVGLLSYELEVRIPSPASQCLYQLISILVMVYSHWRDIFGRFLEAREVWSEVV